MKLNRLWQTLLFFDVIPLINCFKKLLGKTQKSHLYPVQKMNKILITDTETNLTKNLVNALLSKNYPVKILTQNVVKTQEIFGNNVEIINADISFIENVNQQVWQGVTKVICLNQQAINSFILPAIKNLKYQESMLFDFTQNSLELKEIWGAVDDVVMGGISESNIKLAENKAIFSGIVSTENNGGFASVRTKNFNPPWDLSAYEGIQLKVQGDGKRYKFITRCEGKWDGIGYCYSFDTLSNCWITINIPFSDLIPVFRAKTVSDADKFDSSKVYSMQLMLSKFEYDGGYNPKFQAGLFGLEIESIKVYGTKILPHLVLINSYEYDNNLQNSGLNCTIINPTNQFLNDEEIVTKCLEIIN